MICHLGEKSKNLKSEAVNSEAVPATGKVLSRSTEW